MTINESDMNIHVGDQAMIRSDCNDNDRRMKRNTYLYRSYPAAKALPLVGARALSDSFLTSSGGCADDAPLLDIADGLQSFSVSMSPLSV